MITDSSFAFGSYLGLMESRCGEDLGHKWGSLVWLSTYTQCRRVGGTEKAEGLRAAAFGKYSQKLSEHASGVGGGHQLS